jgi:hypothetical protein
VQTTAHRGKLYYAWGDSAVARYPLGLFHMTSATTSAEPWSSLVPPLRVELDYFTDANHQPRAVAPMPGDGPTWVTAYVSLPDAAGASRLVGSYLKIRPPMNAYQSGLCIWNDDREVFEHFKTLWTESPSDKTRPPMPDGHPVFVTDDTGRRWVLFGNPLPLLRCPATFEAWQDPTTWEVLSPQEQLLAADDGAPVKPHSGSIAWNSYRQRWVTVFMQAFGKPSAFGELWYAEARQPTGPWGPAVKVLSHDNYTFYNPRIHPDATPDNSPVLIFEGTYTKQFTDNAEPTPRYDYNQIIYRLNLDDRRLMPAQRLEPELH